VQTNHEKWGPGCCWSWLIDEGRHAGSKIFRTTKTEATLQNSCGKFLMALTGLDLAAASKVDTSDYVGTSCTCIVSLSESGAPRVESFVVNREPGEDDCDHANELLTEDADNVQSW
jgi:hypothetical protein